MSNETHGPALLAEWLTKTGHTRAQIARALGVSPTAVHHWRAGKAAPRAAYRTALHLLCGIPPEAWVTDDERTRAQSALVGAAQVAGSMQAKAG